ncbi:MAG: BamA/TamA family outer membrane protein [Candidatus Aphodosoma sp.]
MALNKHNTICLRKNILRQIVIVFIIALLSTEIALPQQYVSAEQISDTTKNNISKSSSKETGNRWNSLMNWNFMALPFASYSPETNWQFGLTGVYFFKTNQCPTYSDINFNFCYTLNKQWIFNINSRLYFSSKIKWYLDTDIHTQHYPDKFFGISNSGNNLLSKSAHYISNSTYFEVRPNFHIISNFYIGAIFSFRYSYNDFEAKDYADISDKYDISGLEKEFYIKYGATFFYDTRDYSYYPTKGIFVKTAIISYQPILNAEDITGIIDIDYRHFVPIYKDFLFAYHFRNQWSIGKTPSFEFMPTIGGQDLLRGVRQNVFRGNCLYALDLEFRIPIWKFLKGTVFTSIGDVINIGKETATIPKIGYGIGLRANIHDARTNIRFDVARNAFAKTYQNYNNEWSFYFTIKEAF